MVMQNFKSTGSTGAGSETGGRQSVPLPTAQHPAQLTSLETLVRENGELRFLLKSLTEESAARGAIESVRLQNASAATAKTVEALSRRLELAAAETQRLELAVSLRDRALLEAEALGLRRGIISQGRDRRSGTSPRRGVAARKKGGRELCDS